MSDRVSVLAALCTVAVLVVVQTLAGENAASTVATFGLGFGAGALLFGGRL